VAFSGRLLLLFSLLHLLYYQVSFLGVSFLFLDKPCSVSSESSVHIADVRPQNSSLVFQLLQLHLECRLLLVLALYSCFSVRDHNLAHLVLLLKVNDELVLSLNNSSVFLAHPKRALLCCLPLHDLVISEIVQRINLLVQRHNVVIFHEHQLLQLLNFFLYIFLLSLVTFQHSEKAVDAVVA